MSEETTQPTPEELTEEQPAGQPIDLRTLLNNVGGPTEQIIEGWKEKHGDVFVSVLSDDDVYLFRPLKRSEHRELQEALGAQQLDQLSYEEELCTKCVLFNSADDVSSGKGGVATTLAEQIMQQSHFMSPQAAGMLVFKL